MKRLIILISFVFAFLSLSAGADNGSRESSGLSSFNGDEPIFMELKVFPNPVTEKKFTVELSNLNLREIHILNIAGKQVYEKKVLSNINRFEVNVEDLPDGIYFLKVHAAGNVSKTVKLMISSPR